MEQLKDYGRSLKYYFQREKNTCLTSPQESISLLGDTYGFVSPSDQIAVNHKLALHLQQTLYFSYRSGFVLQLAGVSISSDSGWGCMLRVGQMMMAQAFKRLSGGFFYPQFASREEQERVAELFQDTEESLFGIQSICKTGRENYSIAPQAWMTPSQICHVMQDLFYSRQQEVQARLQNRLEIVIFRDTVVFGNEILACFNHDYDWQKGSPAQTERLEKNVIILVMAKIGAGETLDSRYTGQVRDLMNMSQFNGVLGGRDSQARFLLGLHGQETLYLDPHCTVPVSKGYTGKPKVFSCPLAKVSSSLCISFLVRSYSDAQQWVEAFQQVVHSYGSASYFTYKDTNDFHFSQLQPNANNEEDSWEVVR